MSRPAPLPAYSLSMDEMETTNDVDPLLIFRNRFIGGLMSNEYLITLVSAGSDEEFFKNGEPIKLPDNLESLPRADSFPSQRHRWNTNESTCRVSVSNMVLSAVQEDHNVCYVYA
uniref:Uncharacterized protein n=1 Tax=Glossina palpalis gambiensis TaxID=67801 RepID=A0A1B0BEF2_9MUSC